MGLLKILVILLFVLAVIWLGLGFYFAYVLDMIRDQTLNDIFMNVANIAWDKFTDWITSI